MKKRALLILLSLIMTLNLVAMTGCAGNKDEGDADNLGAENVDYGRIYDGTKTATVLMDKSYSASENSDRTYSQVLRAANDLRQDIAMVTGAIDYKEIQQTFADDEEKKLERLENADQSKVPQLKTGSANAEYAIIIGVIGESELIDEIIESGSFDEAKSIEGSWEAYAIKEIPNPASGIDAALVIAGSDARGAIYGIYTISEEIGVSPFYWYSDVPVDVKDEIDVNYSTALVEDGPEVKYRGIFINDEEKSTEWAKLKYPTENGSPDVNYYRHVFELVLRMKANTLWPAMHGSSTAFNKAVDEDGIPINAQEAAAYGVIMAASHCEILLRNNVGEWGDWFNEHKSEYPDIKYPDDSYKAYDFTLNREMLLDYWRERLETNKDFESILTLGVRGPHDEAFNCEDLSAYEGATEEQKKVSFMEDVIQSQRQLIAEIYGEDMVTQIPQVLIPYKEMNDVYNAGLNEFMLWDGSEDFNGDGEINYLDDNTDIMLMWAEDNENYLRQDLTEAEANRPGGAGVYYHISYWGPPSSYLWLNSASLFVMTEQMSRAYNIGADDYWILNVGDIKPSEPSMEYFLKMAWDPASFDGDSVGEYLTAQAIRDYNLSEEDAKAMADAICEYYVINGSIRKAEFYANGDYNIHPVAFSVIANGDEGLLWVERLTSLVDTVDALYQKMSDECKLSFYEHFYYNILSCLDIAEQFVYYEKNQLAAEQGRLGSANVYAELALEAVQRTKDRLSDFNSLNDNKWTSFMDYAHPGKSKTLVGDSGETMSYVTQSVDTVGAYCENGLRVGAGTLRLNSLIPSDTRYFDVFSCASIEKAWVAETSDDWIVLSQTSGATRTEQRVLVSADWDKVSGTAEGEILIYNADENGNKIGEAVATFDVIAVNSDVEYGDHTGYIEANGYVAIEAEHYSEAVEGDDGRNWQVFVSNGRHGDTVKAMPDTAVKTEDWDSTAKLVYSVYFENAGTYKLTLERMPVLNEGTDETGAKRTMNIAVGVSDDEPQVLVGECEATLWGLRQSVMDMHQKLSCNITVEQGWNDIVVYMSDASFVWDRMVIETVSGALRSTVLGPAESPNNIAPIGEAKVASLPEELASYSPENEIVLSGLGNIRMSRGTEKTYELDVYATNGSEVKISAASDNPDVADVSIADGGYTVTASENTGSAALTFTFSAEGCDDLTYEISVRVSDPNQGTAYFEEGGEVVIDAANALDESQYSWTDTDGNYEWTLTSDRDGLSIQPDTGVKWENTSDNLSGAPSLNYMVEINNSGTYYLFVNMSAPNADADSYHVVVDGKYAYTHNSGDMSGEKVWKSASVGTELSAGEHTITIVPREDGFVINQIVLTANKNASFTDGVLEGAESTAPSQSSDGDDGSSDSESIVVDSGSIVIDATSALDESDTAWTDTTGEDEWVLSSDGCGLSIQPDTGAKWENTSENLSGAPSVNYKIDVNSAGTYYLFVNMSAPDMNSDSYHVMIDGEFRYTHAGDPMNGDKLWKSAGRGIDLSAGEHTITIVPREDGFVINQIVLTTNKNANFSDGVLVNSDAQASQAQSLARSAVWSTAFSSADKSLGGSLVRQQMRLSSSGDSVSLVISNQYGKSDLVIEGMSIAKLNEWGNYEIDSDTAVTVTYNGDERIVVPAGTKISTDAVDFEFEPLECVGVTMSLSEVPQTITYHESARCYTWFGDGENLTQNDFSNGNTSTSWYFVEEIDVISDDVDTIICLGDSITDGYGIDNNTLSRYSDYLSELLADDPSLENMAVAAKGIGGDWMGAIESRFSRDVLNVNGAKYCVILAGINTIGFMSNNDSASVINQYKTWVDRCHAIGMKVIGVTVLPFKNSQYDDTSSGGSNYENAREPARLEINDFILNSGYFDAAIDLASMVADEDDPEIMDSKYTNDYLHLNSTGYELMGNAVYDCIKELA